MQSVTKIQRDKGADYDCSLAQRYHFIGHSIELALDVTEYFVTKMQ